MNASIDSSSREAAAQAAIEKLRALVKYADTCFFCTNAAGNVRPMGVREVDDEGNLWFLSAIDSQKNADIAADPTVKLYFQGGPHAEFLYLDGVASISTDRSRIQSLWHFVLRAWFADGKDDRRISAIKVTPTASFYWAAWQGAR